MSEPTPVFDEVFKSNPFKAFPTEYTDRYTPDIARQEGIAIGVERRTEQVLDLIDAIPKPSKQLLALRDLIANMEAE